MKETLKILLINMNSMHMKKRRSSLSAERKQSTEHLEKMMEEKISENLRDSQEKLSFVSPQSQIFIIEIVNATKASFLYEDRNL